MAFTGEPVPPLNLNGWMEIRNSHLFCFIASFEIGSKFKLSNNGIPIDTSVNLWTGLPSSGIPEGWASFVIYYVHIIYILLYVYDNV